MKSPLQGGEICLLLPMKSQGEGGKKKIGGKKPARGLIKWLKKVGESFDEVFDGTPKKKRQRAVGREGRKGQTRGQKKSRKAEEE